MKYALVTGGSRGIGKAICLRLAKMGHHVLINYRSNKEAAEATLKQLIDEGGNGELLQFDVSNSQNTKEVLEQWQSDNDDKCVEVIINNAGIRKDNLMVWMTEEDWSQVIDTNLTSFYTVTSTLLKKLIRNKGGRIINIVSLSGIKGMPGQVNYAAAKAGVIAATKSLAQELGRRKITVNCVAPGFISTDMTEDIDASQFNAMIPLKRFGTPDEVAGVVAFLASDDASYITGEVISVNGGLYT